MAEAHTKHHDYHLVDPSPWPVIGALSDEARKANVGSMSDGMMRPGMLCFSFTVFSTPS